MPKQTWNITIDGQPLEVKTDIGRRQRIWVNDELVVEQKEMMLGTKDVNFKIGNRDASVRMKPGMLKNSLELIVDGYSADTGQAVAELEPMPWWGWIFVVLCFAMVIGGGAIPAGIGAGSAMGVYSVARNPDISTTMRVVYSAGITVAAWAITIFIVGAISVALF